MIQDPVPHQINHPRQPCYGERIAFDQRSPSGESPSSSSGSPSSSSGVVGKGSYSDMSRARTTVPTRTPPASIAHQVSRSMTTTAVPHHAHRRPSGYVMSTSSPHTVGNTSRGVNLSSQRARRAKGVESEAPSSSWISESAPPPHARSLYATIPLPPDESPRGCGVHPPHDRAARSIESLKWSSSSSPTTVPPHANPNPGQFPLPPSDECVSLHGRRQIELHPLLKSACIVRSLVAIRAQSYSSSSSSSSSRPSDWAQVRDEPATMPSAGYLPVVINSTGQTICVWPTSPKSPHIVTVGDVVDELEAAAMTVDHTCRGRCGPTGEYAPVCMGEGLSVILNCLQLWWTAPERGADAGVHPWQLVVRRG